MSMLAAKPAFDASAASSGLTGCNDAEIYFVAMTDAFSLILAVRIGVSFFFAESAAASAADPPVPDEFSAALFRLLPLSLMSRMVRTESNYFCRSLSELTLNSELR